eukprot:403356342
MGCSSRKHKIYQINVNNFTQFKQAIDAPFKVDKNLQHNPFFNSDENKQPNPSPDKTPYKWALWAKNQLCSQFFLEHHIYVKDPQKVTDLFVTFFRMTVQLIKQYPLAIDIFKQPLYAGISYIVLNDLKLNDILMLKQQMMLKDLIEQFQQINGKYHSKFIINETENYFSLKEIEQMTSSFEQFQKQNQFVYQFQIDLKHIMEIFDFQQFMEAKNDKKLQTQILINYCCSYIYDEFDAFIKKIAGLYLCYRYEVKLLYPSRLNQKLEQILSETYQIYDLLNAQLVFTHVALFQECLSYLLRTYQNQIIHLINNIGNKHTNIILILNFHSQVNESKKFFTTITLQMIQHTGFDILYFDFLEDLNSCQSIEELRDALFPMKYQNLPKDQQILEQGSDLYIGSTYRNQMKLGFGTLFTKAGDKFYGYWHNNRLYQGLSLMKDGLKIIGTFPSGNLSDIYEVGMKSCSIKWDKEGHVFEKQSEKNDTGSCREYFKNGAYFIGLFRKGFRNGKGRYVFHGEIYEGFFRDDQRHGFGLLTLRNGVEYEGDWFKGQKHGKAIISTKENDRFEGQFKDGKCQGLGKYKKRNGEVLEVTFEEFLKQNNIII